MTKRERDLNRMHDEVARQFLKADQKGCIDSNCWLPSGVMSAIDRTFPHEPLPVSLWKRWKRLVQEMRGEICRKCGDDIEEDDFADYGLCKMCGKGV